MTFERKYIRAQKQKDLDRETWSDLEKIEYNIRVEGRGEAIAGPFWFGQAFDDSPRFTFSAVADNYDVTAAPQFTVGVAEWLQDDQNMYVGAMLWFAWDACWEEFKGGVVFFEDFENILDRQGGGPWGNEIPSHNSNGGFEIGWPSLNQGLSGQALDVPIETWATVRHEDGGFPEGHSYVDFHRRGSLHPYKVIQQSIVDEEEEDPFASNWYVSTENPRPNTGGTSHLRRHHDANEGELQPLQGVRVGNILPCVIPDNETFNEEPNKEFPFESRSITARPLFAIREGMIVTCTMDAMISESKGNDQVGVNIDFYDSDANFIGQEVRPVDDGPNETFFLEEHWQTFQQVLPITPWGGTDSDTEFEWPQDADGSDATEDIRYMSVLFNCAYNRIDPPYPQKVWDIDNLKVEISGDIPEMKVPSFRVNISFEGVILKNYGNIHPFRSYEAPAKVVLS